MLLLLVVLLCANIYSLVKHLNSLKNELNLTLVGIPRTVSLRISPYLIFNCQSQNSDISYENTPWMLIWTQHQHRQGRALWYNFSSAVLSDLKRTLWLYWSQIQTQLCSTFVGRKFKSPNSPKVHGQSSKVNALQLVFIVSSLSRRR